jgi:hypothetical protein
MSHNHDHMMDGMMMMTSTVIPNGGSSSSSSSSSSMMMSQVLVFNLNFKKKVNMQFYRYCGSLNFQIFYFIIQFKILLERKF